MKVEVYRLSKRLTIRRYIDLPRLFELLVLGRLYLPTQGTLAMEDPFECGITFRKRYHKVKRKDLEDRARQLSEYAPGAIGGSGRTKKVERYFELISKCTKDQLVNTILTWKPGNLGKVSRAVAGIRVKRNQMQCGRYTETVLVSRSSARLAVSLAQ